MLEQWYIAVIIAMLLGFLSGIGVGGGSLLMLWLTLILQTEHVVARNINLLFFIPSALIATLFRWKQGVVDIKSVLPGILAGCICAGIFSWISQQMDITLLKKCFGVLLLITGIREVFYRPRKPK